MIRCLITMSTLVELAVYILAIIIISLIGGALPYLRKWSSSNLHYFVAISAGVFIGASFLILIPEAINTILEEGGDPHDAISSALMWVMIGFVVLLMIEIIIKERHEKKCHNHTNEHKHKLTSMAAFTGLGIHSAVDGLALGAAIVASEYNSELGAVVFIAILAHKAIDLFSLSTTFCLADIPRKQGLINVALFSLITPIAAIASYFVVDLVEAAPIGILMALAGGTFTFVGIYDLLPEAFHEKHSNYKSYALVVIGILLIFIINMLTGEAHTH